MPGVGIGIIIFNKAKQVLLILRNSDSSKAKSDMHLEGTWTLPSGKVNIGETLIEAAVRKVKEEVNLTVQDLEIVSIADDINVHSHFVTVGLLARMWDGEVSLGNTEEHVDYDFFDIDNLPSNLCFPSNKILNNYVMNTLYKEDK